MTFLQTLYPPKIDTNTPVEYWVVTLRQYEGIHYGNQTLREQTTWGKVSRRLLWEFDVPANTFSVIEPMVVLVFDNDGQISTSLRTKSFFSSIPGDIPIRSIDEEKEFLELFHEAYRLGKERMGLIDSIVRIKRELSAIQGSLIQWLDTLQKNK